MYTDSKQKSFYAMEEDTFQEKNVSNLSSSNVLNLPIIDISPSFSQDLMAKKFVAKQIEYACRETGFFLITGHGITKSFMERFYVLLRQFFKLPLQEKSKFFLNRPDTTSYNDDSIAYGYRPSATDNVYAFMGEKGPNDLAERINVGPRILQDEPVGWLPKDEQIPHLQQMMKQFYKFFGEISIELSKLFALAIDLPENFFIKKMDKAYDYFNCNFYPALNDVSYNNGVPPHTDGGLLTIVTQEHDGLEILDKNQQWQLVKVPSSIDTFVVNIGDLMMRWSNDEWISTKHRVLIAEQSRLSTAFFKAVNGDTVVECLPKFTQNRAAIYPPVTFSEFACEKLNRGYKRM